MTNCVVEQVNSSTQKYWKLNRLSYFKDNDYLNKVLGKRWNYIDRVMGENPGQFYKHSQVANDIMKSMTATEKLQFVEDMKTICNKARSLYNAGDTSFSIAQALNAKQYSSELIENIQYLETIMKSNNIRADKILSTMSGKRGITDIYDNTMGSLKYAFLNEEGVSLMNLDEYLYNTAIQANIPKQDIQRFVDDIKATPLGTGGLFKFVGGLKAAFSIMKYGPLTGISGGSLLLLNNTVLGTMLYKAKRRGLEGIINHDLINELLENYHILASNERAPSLARVFIDTDGKNMFYNLIEKILDKVPAGEAGKQKLKSIFMGGIHTIRDIGAEGYIKRLAIAQALSKNGINAQNIESFYKMLKDSRGSIDNDFMYKLRADSGLFYQDYFTSGNITTLNRNTFSKRWFINTLQGYVTARVAELSRAIGKGASDLRQGKIKTRGDFVEYINTDNQELKSLLNNILITAKMSIYANRIAGNDEDSTKVTQYMVGVSDYLSSLQTTFFYRILTAPFKGAKSYYEYTEATGKSEEMLEGISVSALNTLSEICTSIFREGKILDVLIDSAGALVKTGNLDFASDVAGVDIDKIINGMGRYMLLPGIDTYGQKYIEEKDDRIGRVALSFDTINESMRQSGKLRDIGNIESALNDKSQFVIRALQYLPILGKFIGIGKEGGYNEAKYKMLQDLVKSDETLKGIRAGEFPTTLLDDQDLTYRLYQELSSHAYATKQYKGDGTHQVTKSEGLLSQMEEEVFVQDISEKVFGSREAFADMLKNKDMYERNIVKVLAAAKAEDVNIGSKIVLSYISNTRAGQLRQQLYGEKNVNALSPDQNYAVNRQVVEEFYPYMYTVDKTAWYKLAREQLSKAHPDIYQGIENDNALKGFVNTLGFMDMIVKQQGDTGDVDAGYIKNIFNIGTKYITNESDRIKLVNHVLGTIQSLDVDSSQKQTMKSGVLLANIDFYDKIKKDPVTKIVYKEDIDKFEDIVRQHNDFINNTGIDGLEGEMSSEARRQYEGSKGYPYKKSSNYNSNNAVQEGLQKAFNKNYSPIESGGRNPTQYALTPTYYNPKEIATLAPKRYNVYARFYESAVNAMTKELVTSKGRAYPAEFIEGMKFTVANYNRKGIAAPRGISFPKPRAKYKSYGTRSDLPGSTTDSGG